MPCSTVHVLTAASLPPRPAALPLQGLADVRAIRAVFNMLGGLSLAYLLSLPGDPHAAPQEPAAAASGEDALAECRSAVAMLQVTGAASSML